MFLRGGRVSSSLAVLGWDSLCLLESMFVVLGGQDI